jgi:hypothetical protein
MLSPSGETMTLYLDLNALTDKAAGELADSELLRRVDRRVASYYLAVPLAGEDNRVTVATAYPDNAAALGVLERLLQAAVVPVSSSEAELQRAITRIYPEIAPGEGAIMVWTDDPAWEVATITTANAFGRVAARPVVILDSSTTLYEVLARATYDFSLLAIHVSDEASLERLVRHSPVSLLLVRGEYAPIDRVLVALRGYGSDHETLDRVFPIVAREGAGATVLPLSRPGSARLNDLFDDRSPARRHLETFLSDLDRNQARVDVRLSQGDPATQIVNELAGSCYTLLVMAAEGQGAFVWQVLSRIEREGAWPSRPVLVVKPPVRITHDE